MRRGRWWEMRRGSIRTGRKGRRKIIRSGRKRCQGGVEKCHGGKGMRSGMMGCGKRDGGGGMRNRLGCGKREPCGGSRSSRGRCGNRREGRRDKRRGKNKWLWRCNRRSWKLPRRTIRWPRPRGGLATKGRVGNGFGSWFRCWGHFKMRLHILIF
jgi:hypothetical protein